MSYRWNNDQAAQAYDAAAPVIHPRYVEVQDALLNAVPFDPRKEFRAIDLGGGSGRLVERLLDRFGFATAVVVDQSEAFLRLAHQRLTRFGYRSRTLCESMQSDWAKELAPVDVVVSTSAIHHLESHEKLRLFKQVRGALSPGGLLINGDEHRPGDGAEYRRLLEQWGEHMQWALEQGDIPETFADIIDKWRRRNLEEFHAPRKSGDDCHETIEGQTELLNRAGFANVEVVWHADLWAVTVAS